MRSSSWWITCSGAGKAAAEGREGEEAGEDGGEEGREDQKLSWGGEDDGGTERGRLRAMSLSKKGMKRERGRRRQGGSHSAGWEGGRTGGRKGRRKDARPCAASGTGTWTQRRHALNDGRGDSQLPACPPLSPGPVQASPGWRWPPTNRRGDGCPRRTWRCSLAAVPLRLPPLGLSNGSS
jgi:hypothetical protein